MKRSPCGGRTRCALGDLRSSVMVARNFVWRPKSGLEPFSQAVVAWEEVLSSRAFPQKSSGPAFPGILYGILFLRYMQF